MCWGRREEEEREGGGMKEGYEGEEVVDYVREERAESNHDPQSSKQVMVTVQQ